MSSYIKEFEIAKKAAFKAAGVIKKYFSKTKYSLKSRANPVTKADIESENIIKNLIIKNFKEDSIISEESDTNIKDKKRVWLIDPLDGTVNYAHSFPHFAVSIGFVEGGDAKMGIIYDVMKDEFFHAIKGKGAYLNDKRIFVSDADNLRDSLLATGFAYDRAEKAEYYCSFYSAFLKRTHDIRRCGAASLDIAWVSCGRLDGYWEFNLKPWDVGAGKVILEEAGGKLTDFDMNLWGKNLEDIKLWGIEVLATNSKIHKEMFKIIKRIK